jgi:hypothetical protein
MNLVRKYTLVGAIWGLVIGYGAVAVATGLGVAFLWTLVYGDGPWADNTTTVLYGLALVALVGTLLLCTALGHAYGKWADRQPDAARRGEHRRAHLLLAAALVSSVLGGYQLYAQNTALAKRQAWLDELLVQRHVIDGMRVAERTDHGALELTIDTRGQRAGQYLLAVMVHDGQGRLLHQHRETLEAPGHEISRTIEIRYATVLQRVREFSARTSGSAAAGGRERLTIVARLTPVLERRELRALPRHAAMNYQAPDSPFHSEQQRVHQLEYQVEGSDYWIALHGQWHRIVR